jgi:hypothetical protein
MAGGGGPAGTVARASRAGRAVVAGSSTVVEASAAAAGPWAVVAGAVADAAELMRS